MTISEVRRVSWSKLTDEQNEHPLGLFILFTMVGIWIRMTWQVSTMESNHKCAAILVMWFFKGCRETEAWLKVHGIAKRLDNVPLHKEFKQKYIYQPRSFLFAAHWSSVSPLLITVKSGTWCFCILGMFGTLLGELGWNEQSGQVMSIIPIVHFMHVTSLFLEVKQKKWTMELLSITLGG